jgi:trypsin
VVKINRDPLVPRPGGVVRVLGAGDTRPAGGSGDSRSDVLQQVDLQAIGNAACEGASSAGRNASYAGRIRPSHLCTGYDPDNSRDACDYDSGSPIVVAGDDRDGRSAGPSSRDAKARAASRDVLVGLVSWGMECADPDFPGTFLEPSRNVAIVCQVLPERAFA